MSLICLLLCSLQYGVELDVPAATILSIFGLRAQVGDICIRGRGRID